VFLIDVVTSGARGDSQGTRIDTNNLHSFFSALAPYSGKTIFASSILPSFSFPMHIILLYIIYLVTSKLFMTSHDNNAMQKIAVG